MDARDHALAVIVLTAATRHWLADHDPQALAQATDALRGAMPDVDVKIAGSEAALASPERGISEQDERAMWELVR